MGLFTPLRTVPVSRSWPALFTVSRFTQELLNEVTKTEPSLATSTELESEPVKRVLTWDRVATLMTATGVLALPSVTRRNRWSGVNARSSPGLAIGMGFVPDARCGAGLDRSMTQTLLAKSV